jgi:arylsulfatase A-like enzyme
VSLIDLMPTLVGMAGGETPRGVDAATLLPMLVGEAPAALGQRPLVINESEQYAVLQWPHKLLVRPAEHLVELYDLGADFQERHDLSGTQGHRVRELKRLYRHFPKVQMDRSARGRQQRELIAQPPAHR